MTSLLKDSTSPFLIPDQYMSRWKDLIAKRLASKVLNI